MQRAWRLIQLVACFGACDAAAHLEADGLRVGTWNITFYDGGFASEVGAVVYGQFEGRSFAPGLLVMQEFSGTTAALGFLAALNSHPESPGDWELAPFLDVGDLNVVVYYRESQLDLEQRVLLSPNFAGGPARAVQRWDFRLDGYASEQASLSVYGVHFKAGSTPSDQSRRLVEAEIIRQDAASLPVGRPFLLAGDLNIQSSSQAAYQTLVERIASVDPVGRGQLFDPILTPGEWQNNAAFRYVHTQDPATQVDDRYDQILLSGDLINGDGLDYIGDPTRAYSTTTWDDPNHSYRAWGNDGTTYNRALRLDGNAMVGRDIAADITTLCFGGGHMPVFLDLQVPARLAVAEQIDVGRITPGTTVRVPVANGADIARWGESGIDALRFFAFGSAGVDVPFEFVEVPPAETATVEATLTGAPGPFSGTLTIASNDPDRPDVEVLLTGTLI
ncbi:MAG: hypothetical protein AAFY46_05065, partial [Planctomycetota bacterium]